MSDGEQPRGGTPSGPAAVAAVKVGEKANSDSDRLNDLEKGGRNNVNKQQKSEDRSEQPWFLYAQGTVD